MKSLRYSLLIVASLLAVTSSIFVSACAEGTSTKTVASQPGGKVMPTEANPIVIDPANRELRIAAKVNGATFTTPTWHAVVYTSGQAAGDSVFQSYASPQFFYDAMKYFGGKPGNNMPMDNYSSTHVEGSGIDVSVTWDGAPKTYSLGEVLKDPDGANGKPINIKFGGNYDRIESGGTGCITCLYSCPMGVSSNAAYDGDDFARQKAAGQAGFLANKAILPADGTPVVITFKVQ